MNDRPAVPGAIRNATNKADVVAPPMSNGMVSPAFSIERATSTISSKEGVIKALNQQRQHRFVCFLDDPVCRDHYPKIGNFVAIALHYQGYQVFSYIVHVTFYRCNKTPDCCIFPAVAISFFFSSSIRVAIWLRLFS
jgi:hypothetical protein